MDFSLTEEQQELAGLARQIFEDRMTLPHLKEIDRSDDWFDAATWAELAKANLLGIAVPEEHGGLGLGFVELCLVLAEQGRYVAPVPLVPALAGVGLAVARFGTESQRAELAPLAAGERFAVPALHEYGAEPEQPTTRAKPDGDGWRLEGVKTAVPMVHVASAMLVPATTEDGRIGLFLVGCGADGVVAHRQQAMGYEPQFEVHLDGVAVDAGALLGGDLDRGREILDFVVARTTVAYCAVAAGLADRALRITAQYTCDRKQFDRPIGTFQAVGQRLADAFIDTTAIELTMLQAASHLAEGREVPLEVATAKFWAADGGSRVVHAALHVHGGISIDLDYPIHRYFLWMKRIENTLGGATPQLLRIGKALATDPA
jgi:alkylation response protein AidB-like acyl-CoA dehydrogenase